jgi:23S rRNA pseudouridine1911/1915/1917 synthase
VSRSRNQSRGRPAPSPAASTPAAAAPTLPTLAAVVRGLAPGTSWEQARTLCRAGRVWVDGRPVTDPAWRPAAGAGLAVLSAAAARARRQADGARAAAGSAPRRPRSEAGTGAGAGEGAGGEREAARDGDLVVYADADVVVVRKPPGVLTVPFDRGDRDTLLALARVALRRLEARRARSGRAVAAGAAATPAAVNPTLRAVQRLDRDTSGLLVFARNVAAQRALQQQLARREVGRRYEALVHGAAADATLESWLIEDRGDGLRGSWRPGPAGPPPGARHAVTHVRALEALRGATRVACELETGRQHQIRIHLAEAGHPLVGETVYVRDYAGPRIPAPRPMLHAAALSFRHPRDGRPLRFEEPPPADFAEILQRLRRRRR